MGRLFVEFLAEYHGQSLRSKKKLCAAVAEFVLDGQPVVLARPEDFMNVSGHAVRLLTEHFSADSGQDLLVAVDDMALPLGNPVSLIIAFKAKLDIYDFMRHALPIFAINLAVVVPVCRYWLFKNDFNELNKWPKTMIETGDDKLFSKKFLSSWILLGGTLLGLAVSPLLEKILNLDKNILLMAIPLAGMAAVVFMEGKNAKNIVQNNVDWWTLFFFAALFIVIGAMTQVNIMENLSKKMLVVPLKYLPFMITGF